MENDYFVEQTVKFKIHHFSISCQLVIMKHLLAEKKNILAIQIYCKKQKEKKLKLIQIQ